MRSHADAGDSDTERRPATPLEPPAHQGNHGDVATGDPDPDAESVGHVPEPQPVDGGGE